MTQVHSIDGNFGEFSMTI